MTLLMTLTLLKLSTLMKPWEFTRTGFNISKRIPFTCMWYEDSVMNLLGGMHILKSICVFHGFNEVL